MCELQSTRIDSDLKFLEPNLDIINDNFPNNFQNINHNNNIVKFELG